MNASTAVGPQQVVVPAQVVLLLADREQQDVVARTAGGLHQQCANRSIAAFAVPSWAGLNLRPIRCEERVRRLRAARLGESPSSSIASCTRANVSERNRSGLLMAFETVRRETPRALGDVRERRRRDGIADRHRPTSPLATRLDRSKPGRGRRK